MVKLPSASRLSLAMKCAGSFILPQVKSDPGEAAKRGTAIHALVENYINSQRTTPEGLGETQRALLRKVDELLGPPAKVFERSELAVAVYPGDHSSDIFRLVNGSHNNAGVDSVYAAGGDVQAGVRRLPVQGQNLNLLGAGWGLDCAGEDRPELVFEYLFGSDEGNDLAAGKSARKDAGPDRHQSFLAIADCIRCHDEGSYEVWDWKTGSSYVPEPQWNWQLILPAVALWLCSGKRSDFRCSASIFYVDRDVDARPYIYDSEFCSRALFFLKRLYDTAQGKTAQTVDLYEGKHCVFCPARDRCPAKVGALAAAIRTALHVVPNEQMIIGHVIALTETSAMRKKAGESILEAHGGVFNLGDGREAVLDKSGKRTKIYTRKATSGQEERSNAQEDGQSGTEGE